MPILPLCGGMPDCVDALAEFRHKGFDVTGLYPESRGWEV